MRYLSLYSGIGMHDLGFERAGWTCVGQVEFDPFCSAVLEKHWPDVPRWGDVRECLADDVVRRCGRIDLLTGGFACQDVSSAGRRAGLTRFSRSGVTFRNLFRLARGLRPDWIVIENVAALRGRGYDRIAGVMERIGYAVTPLVVGASDLGATHQRRRVWIVCRLVADDRGAGLEGRWRVPGGPGEAVPVPPGRGVPRWPAGPDEPQHDWEAERLVEHRVGRAVPGSAEWMDRFARRNAVKAVGNGNPPQVAELIARTINRTIAAAAAAAAAAADKAEEAA